MVLVAYVCSKSKYFTHRTEYSFIYLRSVHENGCTACLTKWQAGWVEFQLHFKWRLSISRMFRTAPEAKPANLTDVNTTLVNIKAQ